MSIVKADLLAVLLAVLLGTVIGMVDPAEAKVTGVCSNCHTMHNSQAGTSTAHSGTNAAWNGLEISEGSSADAQQSLLITDCVGCHSSTGTTTIVTIGDSKVPIVYNQDIPSQPLAGGNFYWMAHEDNDSKGHNVRGISAEDAVLHAAPGSVGCANSCHVTLTLTDAQTDGHRKNGCQGCHNSVRHHGVEHIGIPVDEDGGWYRFLSAPTGHSLLGGGGVSGIEDANWEQIPSATAHNVYYSGTGGDSDDPQSVGKFCAGCHYKFHSPGVALTNFPIDNGGGSDPWLRHPADAVIPNDYEYAAVIGSAYDPLVPVAKPNLGSYDGTKVENGDRVMCLSCHRAHGSPYPDMLRWDNMTMLTGAVGPAAGKGCFKCHTTKDGV